MIQREKYKICIVFHISLILEYQAEGWRVDIGRYWVNLNEMHILPFIVVFIIYLKQ